MKVSSDGCRFRQVYMSHVVHATHGEADVDQTSCLRPMCVCVCVWVCAQFFSVSGHAINQRRCGVGQTRKRVCCEHTLSMRTCAYAHTEGSSLSMNNRCSLASLAFSFALFCR